MLDSPFSRIPPARRNLVIKELGKLRQQVIMVAHDAELSGVTALSTKIGKEFDIRIGRNDGPSRILPKQKMAHESTLATERLGDVTRK